LEGGSKRQVTPVEGNGRWRSMEVLAEDSNRILMTKHSALKALDDK